MADIDVVPKKGSNIWLWVIAAIVILAILWAVLAGGGNNPTTGQLLEQIPVTAIVTASA